MKRFYCGSALALVLASCGGGDDAGPTAAQAQTVSGPVEVAQMHFVLRPANDGRWYIQNDIDHASVGVLPQIEQGADYLRVFFERPYTHAGVIQVTSDDDFRDRIGGYSNLGLNNATIRVTHAGQVIDPATVYSYVPVGSGNFWVTVTMVNKPKS
jgi:hypothetical protein